MLAAKRKMWYNASMTERTCNNMIEIRGLVKSYGEVRAVRGIDLDVRRGTLFAFLGLNGAGKSTTINIICTLLRADAGSVIVAGQDVAARPDKVRASLGVVFQGSVLDPALTVRENLVLRAGLYGLSGRAARVRVDELSEMLGLGGLLGRRYGRLSGGQRRRTDVARALIGSPELLVLDEPTTGLDPQTRRAVWETLDHLREKSGLTVLLTTHYMEEAERADEVTIIDAGKCVAHGTPAQLKTRYAGDSLFVYAPRSERLDGLFGSKGGKFDSGRYVFALREPKDAVRLLGALGDDASDFEVIKGTMDDVFLSVTGKRAGEGGDAWA